MVHENIEWMSELETGIRLIDSQHREFIGLVNRLLDSSMVTEDGRLLSDSFAFLKYYISEHFSLEETAMCEYSYPFYLMHKAIHDSFREEIDSLEISLMINRSPHDMAMKLNYLMVNWFMNHIKTEDKKLTKYLLAQTADDKKVLASKLDQIVGAFFRKNPRRFISGNVS